MRRMPITDAFFLLAESRRTPMHVGGLNLFTLPKDVDDTTFLANLGNILRNDGDLRRPSMHRFFGLTNTSALFLVTYGVFLQVYVQVVTGVKLVSRDWKRAGRPGGRGLSTRPGRHAWPAKR